MPCQFLGSVSQLSNITHEHHSPDSFDSLSISFSNRRMSIYMCSKSEAILRPKSEDQLLGCFGHAMFFFVLIFSYLYTGVSKYSGIPKWMVKIMENPINIDDFGVPLFLEILISLYTFHITYVKNVNPQNLLIHFLKSQQMSKAPKKNPLTIIIFKHCSNSRVHTMVKSLGILA